MPVHRMGTPCGQHGITQHLYLVLLRVGFAKPVCHHTAGKLLPHHFTLTPTGRGGVFSVALSAVSRRPDVIWHSALWSSDFPPRRNIDEATAR